MDLFREKHTPQTECGSLQRVSAVASKCVVSFYGLGNFISEWEDCPNSLWEGVKISRNWAAAHFLVF